MTCKECGEPLTFATGTLVFHGREMTGDYFHEDCAPDMGYCVRFPDLLKDGIHGPSGWYVHLTMKQWFKPIPGAWELDWAYELAEHLKDIETPKVVAAPVEKRPRFVPTKPYTPRTPRAEGARNISARLRAQIMERDGFRCRRCGVTPDHAELRVDHIVPVAKGGTADSSNLQTLCHDCNAGKADRAPHPRDLEVTEQARG